MASGDLKYTPTHEWVKDEGGGVVSVGITAFAVEELGDIIFVELPPGGKDVRRGAPFGAVESVKAVFDLNSPVSGEVIDANSAVSENPEIVKRDPYGAGWLVKVRLEKPAELDELLDEEQRGEKAE